jgi:glycosyltransferase involved in cell wall biosynthesis
MLISLGILAHNEASDIGNIIADIGNQTLLVRDDLAFEIHVVANGCTDGTVEVAKHALADSPFQRNNVNVFVHNLNRSGKSYAWNELIHRYASPITDFIFLLDADIRIPERESLLLMLDKLRQSKTASVAIDRSEKDLSTKTQKSFVERVILAGSGTAYDTRTVIAGGLYCARFDVLRSIIMPIGLPGEDGFLRAMILTSGFNDSEDISRLVFVDGARHIFESERTISGVFNHNIRLAIGTAINVLLFNHLRAQRANNPNINITAYISNRNQSDSNWINDLIKNEIKDGKYFLLNSDFILKRLKRLSSFTVTQRAQRLPITLFGIVFDIVLYLRANQLMRRGAGAGYW